MSVSLRPPILAMVLAGAIALGLVGLGADSAAAKSTIFTFSNVPSSTQAGGHPDVVTTFEVGNRFNQGPMPLCECNDPKDLLTHTPAGLVANPHVVSECTAAELATVTCPPEAQSGFVLLKIFSWVAVPLYRTVPQSGQAALFVFNLPAAISIPQYLSVNARTGGDFGLDFRIFGITHALSPESIINVFWGVPGEPAHDVLRFGPGERAIECTANPLASLLQSTIPEDCKIQNLPKQPVPSSLPVAPFIQAPTTCVGPLSSSLETLAYDHETDFAEALWPETTGCDKLSFDPSLAAAPTTTETDSASGLAADLRVPQYQDPNTPSPSEIRASTITLPVGFAINPNAADGKVSCSDAQANLRSEEPAACPEFSKVGTTTLDTAALPGPISGSIYLGDPKPGDRYRLIVTASGFGTNVKIASSVHLDPQTGQVVTSFDDLPQAPFQEFDLHFFGSERGLLATPEQCGTYPVKTTFRPWAAEISDQTSTQFFNLDSGPGGEPCPDGPRPFSPAMQAGTTDNTAGVHSSFAVQLSRPDGDQNLTGVSISTPPGFAATLKGIPYCPEAAIARFDDSGYAGRLEQETSSCPTASQVGTALAGVGAGSRPLYVRGRVYLAGPHKGSPLSLLVVIPAVSGPYDLGSVAVRVAIEVDPETAQVTAISDPLPQILEGIPLRTRFIKVDLDRPGFALNPTNCDPFSIKAAVSGDEGALAGLSSHYQVANCADLPYAPKLSLRLSGGTSRLGHPAIHALLKAEPGEANTRAVSVTLPAGEFLDNSHFRTICTRVNFSRRTCPAGSLIGHATVTTPILDQPLEGPAYLRSSSHELPDIAIDLRGQIDIVLVARIDSVAGRLRTTFASVPDAPVSSVRLDILGGSKGLIQNSKSLCGRPRRAKVRMTGQNRVAVRRELKLQVACRSRAKQRRDRLHLDPPRWAR